MFRLVAAIPSAKNKINEKRNFITPWKGRQCLSRSGPVQAGSLQAL
jgi:hypothetical protein